jgi:CNT family concentrative nucleoside transporter
MLPALQSSLGLVVLLAVAWSLSENRNVIAWRTVVPGLVLQVGIAALLLNSPLARDLFLALNNLMAALERATTDGTSFVFGYLGGGPLPFEERQPGASFVLAFRALPLILVVSALSAVLFHWRVLPWIVRGFSWVLQRFMAVGGAVGVSTAANVFVGMTEAPLLVRPYLKAMTRSELFMLMVCGMATIAGTVMVLYASIVQNVIPGAMGHILTASIISAPAALIVAALMVPPTATVTAGAVIPPLDTRSTMDAVTKGTLQGVQLLLNVIAMLIVLVALISLANQLLQWLPDIGGEPVTLQRLFGYVMAPVMWLIGIPWAEARTAGSLMGIKTVLNEFIAYLELAKLPAGSLSDRSELILVYAMCGFANFGSLGIMIGGLGTMVPERRDEIVALGLKSIIAGTIATCMTGAVVGIFVH